MENQRLKPHPFEFEVDRVICELGGDLSQMKQTFDSGVMYWAMLADIPLYIALPTFVPGQMENILRVEFTIGSIQGDEVPRLLFAVGMDPAIHNCCSWRVVPRTKDRIHYEILLQCVANANLVQEGFMASTILYGIELAQTHRDQFLTSQSQAA